MAKPKKTRKELLKEPDEFITTTAKLIRWATTYRTQLMYGLLAVVVLASGFSALRYFSNRAEANAAVLLQQAVTKYEQLSSKNESPAEMYKAVSEDFNRIIDKYGDKENGKMARLRFANLCFQAGEFKQAAALYTQSRDDFEKFPLLRRQVAIDLAMAYAAMGEDQTAIAQFEEIVAAETDDNKGEALFHLGTLYARTGQSDKSRAAFARLSSEFKDSVYAELVPEPSNS